ncbi:MAG: hypothetical protein MJE77_29070 [Proteobacteria bacterium]|nr:hypothetical protein [Pseudomonadota bacterium]
MRYSSASSIPAVVAFVVAALGPARSFAGDGDRPDSEHLVLAGLGMAIPTYFLGVFAHEGSHAVAAKLVGADVVALQLLPGRHPVNKKFYFGYTEIRGRLSPGRKAFFLIAPKLTDIVVLGGYAAMVGSDALPDNHYGQVALAVLATGFWIDFSKDILPFAEHHDMPRIYTMMGFRSEWARLPLRLVHAGLAAVAAVAVYKGYERIFDESDSAARAAWMVPIMRGSF